MKYWGIGYFEEDLKSLMDLLANIIKSKKEQGYSVFVNATAVQARGGLCNDNFSSP